MDGSLDLRGDTCIVTATVRNPHGLHMRPTTEIVETAKRFASNITAHNDGDVRTDANAKDALQMMALCATCGSPIRIVAEGHDAKLACETLRRLIEKE